MYERFHQRRGFFVSSPDADLLEKEGFVLRKIADTIFGVLNQAIPMKSLAQEFEQSSKPPMREIIPLARRIAKDSIRCVKKFPHLKFDKNACEVGIIPTVDVNFNLHTHTANPSKNKFMQGDNVPSDRDIETTKRQKKKNLCIMNSESGILTCWTGKNFDKKASEKQIL